MSAPALRFERIALIGFGEAGSIFGTDLVLAGCDVATYDILFNQPPARAALRAKVRPADSLAEAVAGA